MKNLLLSNVQKLNEKEFMGYMSGATLVSFWNNGDIEYIPEIQRGNKSVKGENGETILVPIFSNGNVKKIKKSIESKSFYVSQITLNISEDANIVYDEESRELLLNNGTVAILDGHHRVRAMAEINEKNDLGVNLESLIFPIKLTNYDQEKAQEQFYQFTLGTKISSSRVEFFNNKDYSNRIVKELYEDSILSNRIETVKNIIAKDNENSLVTFATLKNAIELGLNTERIDSDEELLEISNYLKEFFAELFKVIPEFNDYQLRTQLKEENSFKCENFAFYGYLAIAEHLQHKDNWKELLGLINEINFNKTTAPWVSRIIKKNMTKKKDKATGIETKEYTYSIINNNQTRKDIGNLMVKAFKKEVSKKIEVAIDNTTNENSENQVACGMA